MLSAALLLGKGWWYSAEHIYDEIALVPSGTLQPVHNT